MVEEKQEGVYFTPPPPGNIGLLRKAVRPVHQLESGKRMTSHQFSTTNADCTDLEKVFQIIRTIPGG